MERQIPNGVKKYLLAVFILAILIAPNLAPARAITADELQLNGPASIGQATISLPENIIAGNDYKIHLSLGGSGDKEVAKDDSDAPFSIVAQ